MHKFTDINNQLLKNYARPIVHMRKQIEMKRFGLIFGSGLSLSFGLPLWPALVESIARDSEVNGFDLIEKFSDSKSLAYQAELLLQHFRKQRADRGGPDVPGSREFEYETIADWKKLVAKHLYAKVPDDFDSAVDNHPYFANLLPLIQKSPMTVTYNFDDFIERALLARRSEIEEQASRGFETVTNLSTQFRRFDAVIYHPNGVYPSQLMESPVDKFVFSEAEFAEQFVGVVAGDQSGLLNHLSKNTCLLIGLSLDDEMLRNLLILTARSNPGNYHYYVHFIDEDEEINQEQRDAVIKANFNVYNLLTLFLTGAEIASLGELLNTELLAENDLRDHAKEIGVDPSYKFYLTGALGVGKSTMTNQLRNLIVSDEWLEPRPDVLAKLWKDLSADEKIETDDWIAKQFRLKNDILRRGLTGLYLVDRPPLDPLSFTPAEERLAKAKKLMEVICTGEADWEIQSGMVILLQEDPDELSIRIRLTGRSDYTKERLDEMDKTLKKLYDTDGVVIVNTRGMTVSAVTKRVAEIIHLGIYKPMNLHARMQGICDGTVKVEDGD